MIKEKYIIIKGLRDFYFSIILLWKKFNVMVILVIRVIHLRNQGKTKYKRSLINNGIKLCQ
jgi:hypothetical protein